MSIEIKLATTFEEQIQRLKERGMEIQDEERAKQTLSDIGYYRLGFYWFPMERTYPKCDRRNHLFKSGASFDTAVNLYNFDRKLRSILSEYLLDIEVNVRTKVVYIISNMHKENPTWFADNRIVMNAFITQFDVKYHKEILNNDVIRRHAERHINDKYAPAWKTLEYMSFGDLIRLIENLKSVTSRMKIYECYGFNEEKTFPNYIDIIRRLRNDCAHGHPLYDTILRKSMRVGKFRGVFKGKGIPDAIFSNLQGALLVIQYMLYYLPGKRGDEFRERMKSFFDERITEDIKPMVGFLKATPWLCGKI